MHRKRMRRDETRTPRFLTFSCHRRLQLLGNRQWRDAFVESLRAARDRHGFELIAWVVMPEHVHLILLPGGVPDGVAVPEIIRGIKQPVAQRAIRRWRFLDAAVLDRIRVGERYRYWQAGGGYDRNLRDADALSEAVEYVHWNPVKRGLVEEPAEWAWSSARWYAGEREGQVPIDRVSW